MSESPPGARSEPDSPPASAASRARAADTAAREGPAPPPAPDPLPAPATPVAAAAAFSIHDRFRALRHRNYRLYWSGQLVSLIGTWMQSVAQGWLMHRLT